MRVVLVLVAVVAVVAVVSGCATVLVDNDGIYSHGADGPVLCGLSVDDKTSVSGDALAAGLDRAQVEQQTLHLYTHRPMGTVDVSTIESVLAGAADRDLAFVTYRELLDQADAGEPAGAGLAFSFDDRDLEGWHQLRPLFDRYRAKVTFFISAYHTFDELAKQQLRDLAADGHDIEYHSTNHLAADEYAAAHGIEAYLADDIAPDLALMRADGYEPTVFAYPFGARDGAVDAAVLEHFRAVRAISYTCPR